MTDIAAHIRIFAQNPDDDFVTKRTSAIKALSSKFAKGSKGVPVYIRTANDIAEALETKGAVSVTETALAAALQKAKDKQANFLLSRAAKDLRPRDAERIKADEAYERFKNIRYGWTDGIVECWSCGSASVWELANRLMWRCKKCGCQFSVTSGTIFSGRKASFQTILHAVALRLHDNQNILQTCHSLGVQYKTAYAWAKKFRTMLGAQNKVRVHEHRWPFLNADKSSAADLIATVNGLLPRELPEQKRADVAQEIILGVLSGELDEKDLRSQAIKYIRRYHRNYENNFRDVSFDAVRGEEDNRTLHDMISEETATEAWNRFI